MRPSPLDTHRLKRGCSSSASASIAAVSHGADSLDPGVAGVRGGHGSVAHHVVDDDDATRPGQPERGVEVGPVARLVRVDEHEVERSGAGVDERLRRRRGRPDDHLDPVEHLGVGEIRPGDGRVPLLQVQRHDHPGRTHGTREPDGGVAGERPELQHPPCARDLRQETEERPSVGGDHRIGHGRPHTRLPSRDERGVLVQQLLGEVGVDLTTSGCRVVPVGHRHSAPLFACH